MNVPPAILEVDDLKITTTSGDAILEEASLTLARGEILGVVGESGSGKSTLALAMLGYTRDGTRVERGSVRIDGTDLLQLPERERRRRRGRVASYVPQEPGQALNPSLRVGAAILDVIREHGAAVPGQVGRVLTAVHLPATKQFARRYPHELSGGQQQRVTIGMALSCQPPVIVFDEPTTGLDVITQAGIIEEIRRLRDERDAAMVYVSHDLAVVAALADRIMVVYAGRVVEHGRAAALVQTPRHPYTRGLIQSIPDPSRPRTLIPMRGTGAGVGQWPAGCPFEPRCPQRVDACATAVPPLEPAGDERSVRCIRWRDTPPVDLGDRLGGNPSKRSGGALLQVEDLLAVHRGADTVVAANGVTFAIGEQQCVALVGESGSGKTTVARAIIGLHRPEAGTIVFDGESLAGHARDRTATQRQRIQYVFQNPYDSLNPRQRIADALARPARLLRGLKGQQATDEVARLLDRVRLPQTIANRYPHQLSGGERQRVAIARALAARPDLLICDEITSALDVSVQAAILEVLDDLRSQLGLTILLITHDLGVVSAIADHVIVLQRGCILEAGPVMDILAQPTDAYTTQLIDAAPRMRIA